jgi:hypothetical protein
MNRCGPTSVVDEWPRSAATRALARTLTRAVARTMARAFGVLLTPLLAPSLALLLSLGLSFGLSLALTPRFAMAQDGLTLLGDEVRGTGPPRSEQPSPPASDDDRRDRDGRHDRDGHRDRRGHRDRDDDCDDKHDDALDGLWGAGLILCGYAAASPFWAPHAAMGDRMERDGYFQHFPYAEADGLMRFDTDAVDNSRTWSGRIRAEYADDFDVLQRAGGQLLLEHSSRLGLDTTLDAFEQPGVADRLWLGDVNATFRFAQSQRGAMRAGIGVNWMADSVDDTAGFNFTYGGEWFPVQPLVLSANLDYGKLGDATLFRAQVTGGVTWHGVEWYSGYEYLDIGRAQLDTVMTGIRIWF